MSSSCRGQPRSLEKPGASGGHCILLSSDFVIEQKGCAVLYWFSTGGAFLVYYWGRFTVSVLWGAGGTKADGYVIEITNQTKKN
ncbi:hypothetical protein JTE90_000915 [Oedothorax gibbosus]|uniref:Uncharacterized protein n=1 Tax=Oedothorax gibbosus TaxID=931172 RepID=A0AAV6VSG7_9ARAC|nr:hypothetical protein JTE90_000915 [Oedothorax gibbosus]